MFNISSSKIDPWGVLCMIFLHELYSLLTHIYEHHFHQMITKTWTKQDWAEASRNSQEKT